MKRMTFPWLALGLGLLIAVGLQQAGALSARDEYALPLLTLLIVCEFGFFVTAIGAVIGIRTMVRQGVDPAGFSIALCCGILAAYLLYLGFRLWPGGFPV